MAFKIMASCDTVVTRTYPVASLTIRKGALVTMVPGAASISLYTTATALAILGIAAHPVASTDTTMQVQLVKPTDMIAADVTEILGTTTENLLTSTGGSSVTFVDASFNGAPQDSIIGSKFKVISMASADQAADTILTATDYSSTDGTITFAALGATGFAAADTIKMDQAGQRLVSSFQLGIEGTYADSITLDQDGTSGDGGGDFFAVVDVDPQGKYLIGYITATPSMTSALRA